MAAAPLISIGEISGTTVVGEELTAGTVIPYGATVTYQWQRSDSGLEGTWEDIVGAISRTYTLTGPESYKYIRVVVTGVGAYTGTIAMLPLRAESVALPHRLGIDQSWERRGWARCNRRAVDTGRGDPGTYQWRKVHWTVTMRNIPLQQSTYIVSADGATAI